MDGRDADPPRGPGGRGSAPRCRPVRAGDTGVAAEVGRAFGVTSPRRAAVLVSVVVALALSVAVPLQDYLALRGELAGVRVELAALRDQVTELERRRALLENPDHIEAQARERLRYARPGETPYIVQLPPPAGPPAGPPDGAPVEAAAAPEPAAPWYTRLWRWLTGSGG